MKNKKLMLKLSIIFVVILLSIGGILLYKYMQVKNAIVKVELKDNLEADFSDTLRVSSFIKKINGKIVDDYVIDTDSLGMKKINFQYINDDGIKIKYRYEINVVDKEAPLIWLGKSYNVVKGSEDNLLEKIMCGDNYDSNPKCVIEGEYDLGKVGNYKLVFKAKDSSGNVSEKKFTLNVNEPSNNESSNRVKSVTKFNDVIKDYKTDNTQIGIDVSKWQGDIDFRKLKKAGVEFVIIRVGSSNGINGENFVDSKFIQNIKNAKNAGLKVGIYFYSYAENEAQVKEQANWIIKTLNNEKLDLPIAFDWEDWGEFNNYNLSFIDLNKMAKVFFDTLNEKGYETMLYGSATYLYRIWDTTNYKIWLAHYTTKTDYPDKYNMWQLTSSGIVNGIDGYVDVNILYN